MSLRNVQFVFLIGAAVIMSAVAVPILRERIYEPGYMGQRMGMGMGMGMGYNDYNSMAVSDSFRAGRKVNTNKRPLPVVEDNFDLDQDIIADLPLDTISVNEPNPATARDYVVTPNGAAVTGLYYPVINKGLLVGVMYGPMTSQSGNVGLYFPVIIPGRLVRVVHPPWMRPSVGDIRIGLRTERGADDESQNRMLEDSDEEDGVNESLLSQVPVQERVVVQSPYMQPIMQSEMLGGGLY